MEIGDLVRDTMVGLGYGNLGLVMEEEKYEGQIGTWVWYFLDQENWRWYSFDERYDVEVISESR
tara:strand:- start:33 stop:224 length:192 start_codon:yes stop_codon:yes gene_type:complete